MTSDALVVVKPYPTLRATYQMRLLAFFAARDGKKLRVFVPRGFKPHPSLVQLMDVVPGTIVFEERDESLPGRV
jgi:hypothetical protein